MNKKPILPPRRRANPIVVQPLNSDRKRFWSDYALLMTWRAVGAKYGVSAGVIYRYAVNGTEPRSNSIRAALGLPALAAAPVCPKCGVVHSRTCRVLPEWVNQAADWLEERQKWRAAHAGELAAVVEWAESK